MTILLDRKRVWIEMTFSLDSEDGDDSWVEGGGGNGDESYGDGELEAAGAGAAWVEVEDVVAGLSRWIVGVA